MQWERVSSRLPPLACVELQREQRPERNQTSAIEHAPSRLPYPLRRPREDRPRGCASPDCHSTPPSSPRHPPWRGFVCQREFPRDPCRPPRQLCVSERPHPLKPTEFSTPPSNPPLRGLFVDKDHGIRQKSNDHKLFEWRAALRLQAIFRSMRSQVGAGPIRREGGLPVHAG